MTMYPVKLKLKWFIESAERVEYSNTCTDISCCNDKPSNGRIYSKYIRVVNNKVFTYIEDVYRPMNSRLNDARNKQKCFMVDGRCKEWEDFRDEYLEAINIEEELSEKYKEINAKWYKDEEDCNNERKRENIVEYDNQE